ncbi:MAG: hypothetical protein ACOCYA_00130 [Spirochaetota bacterium]
MDGNPYQDINTLITPRGRSFEMFFCDDGFIELYDAENPKEGMYFAELDDLLEFIDTIKSALSNISNDKKYMVRAGAVRNRA